MSKHVKLTAPGRIEMTRALPGTQEKVWSYLVESDLRQKWFCAGEIEPREGGKIIFDFDHTRISKAPPPEKYAHQTKVRFEGTVLAYDPPHHLAFTWPESSGMDHTTVTIRLKQIEGGVELHLVHENLHNREYRIGASAGWHAHTDILEDLLADRPATDFWPLHIALEEEYESLVGDDFSG
jgi:uncharacterized protein YndB with AHSA1/START domain